MPHSPAISIVSSCEQATHIGGCGFWIGFGSTLRSGNLKYGPSYSEPPSLNIGMMQRNGVFPDLALVLHSTPNGAELGARSRLRPCRIRRGRWTRRSRQATLLGDARGMVGGEPEHFDVIIVGAGISGVGGAYHLQEQYPEKTFVVLEGLESFGGTWLMHKYPGIRSDSDLYTFGYRFKPWTAHPSRRPRRSSSTWAR
jgi:hypothetical protein